MKLPINSTLSHKKVSMKSVFTKLRGESKREKQEGNTLRDVTILLLFELQLLTKYLKFVFP